MTSRRWTRIALGATTGLLLALAAVVVLDLVPGGESPPDQNTTFLRAPLPPPTLDLEAHTGTRVRLADLEGRAVAVFFGYTHCPDVCPLTLSQLSRVLDELEPDGAGLQVLFVTVDPERDTVERLVRYLEPFHPSVLGLTGTSLEIEAHARSFGVGIVVPPHEDGEAYLVDHTARTFLLDREGRVVAALPSTLPYAELRDAVAALLATVPRPE
jgi:protein SCO1